MAKDSSNVQTVIEYNIERINNAKSTLKTYLTDNDVAVADGTKIDAMAEQLSEVKVGASTAEKVSYTNSNLPGVSNAKGAFDALIVKQVSTGTEITLADNTEYRLTDVTTLTLTYPTGNFECWLKLTFAESGSITVTLPTGTEYLGIIPDFKNGEVWELSIKDGVVVGAKVGGDSGSSAPVKGVDYWTEADKQEIINDVIAAMPDGTEVNY